MNSGRVPPMSVCNGLDIIHSDNPDLQLSELENNLIALRIMFQKIYYLPKSRWTGLKDRVINIPYFGRTGGVISKVVLGFQNFRYDF